MVHPNLRCNNTRSRVTRVTESLRAASARARDCKTPSRNPAAPSRSRTPGSRALRESPRTNCSPISVCNCRTRPGDHLFCFVCFMRLWHALKRIAGAFEASARGLDRAPLCYRRERNSSGENRDERSQNRCKLIDLYDEAAALLRGCQYECYHLGLRENEMADPWYVDALRTCGGMRSPSAGRPVNGRLRKLFASLPNDSIWPAAAERATLTRDRRRPVAVIGSRAKRPFTLCNYDEIRRRESRTPSSRAVSRERTGDRRDEVYLFTDMAVMIDGIARKAGSPP